MLLLVLVGACAALAGTNIAAQSRWTPEIGVRGGFVRVKPAGTAAADESGAFDLPGVGYGSIFAVIPLGGRLALEPSIGFTQLAFGEPTLFFLSGTNVDVGLRANYAITSHVFGALGTQVLYSEGGGQHDAQVGVQAAIGYRWSLSRRLEARVEAQASVAARGYRGDLQPVNTYGVLIGLSARARAAAAADRGGSAHWPSEIGIAAGYTHAHLSGLGLAADFTLLASPGGAAAVGVPAPPTIFLTIPLARRWAVEPGFDIHHNQANDTTRFSGTFSARVNYAVGDHWYAGVGPVMHVTKATGSSAFGVSGLVAAWGARFPLAGDVGGRVEVAYATFKERSGSPFATNTLAIVFAATMPLN